MAEGSTVTDGRSKRKTFGKIQANAYFPREVGMAMYHLNGALESGHVHQERSAGHQPFLKTFQYSAVHGITIPEIICIDDKLISYAHTGLGQVRS